MSIFDSPLAKKYLQMKVSNQINKIRNPRCLYGQKLILNMLNFIFDYKFAKNVMNGKIYRFEVDKEAIDVDKADNVIFFVFATIDSMKTISSVILHNESGNINKNYYLFIVPRDNFLATNQLSISSVKNKITIKNFDFSLLPMQNNLMSLQLPLTFQDFQISQCVIDSLLKICNVHGKFRNIYGRGKDSFKILNNLEKKINEIPDMVDSTLDSLLIMIDRSIDYVTPMMTAFSYGALLDRFFNIQFNTIIVKGSIVSSDAEIESVILENNEGDIWYQIRKMYIKDVPQYLQKKSDDYKSIINLKRAEAKNLQDLTNLTETIMGTYTKIQQHRALSAYILQKLNDCQAVNAMTIQSSLIKNESLNLQQLEYLTVFYPIQTILRIITLASHVYNGKNFIDNYKKSVAELIINNYSVKNLIQWKMLQQKQIVSKENKQSNWAKLVELFDLLPQTPHFYTYIHIIYSPLIIRIIHTLITKQMTVRMSNLLPSALYEKGTTKITKQNSIYVYIIGGITESEIQCLEVLQEKLGYHFIICSNKLIDGERFIKQSTVWKN